MKYIKASKDIFESDNINYRKFTVGYPFGGYSVQCYFSWKGDFPRINDLCKKTIKLADVVKFKVYNDYFPEEVEYYISKKEYKRRIKK